MGSLKSYGMYPVWKTSVEVCFSSISIASQPQCFHQHGGFPTQIALKICPFKQTVSGLQCSGQLHQSHRLFHLCSARLRIVGGHPLNITLVIYNKASINGFPFCYFSVCASGGRGRAGVGEGGSFHTYSYR